MRRFSITLLLILVTALAAPYSFAREDCASWDGSCLNTGSYYADTNTTVWWSVCDDGTSTGGVIGGNEVPAICGQGV